MIVEFDLDRDFFDLNQEFRVISEFKDFRENNVDASRIMWGIYLVEDPESKLYKKIRDRQKRKDEVEKNYLNIPDFKWDDYTLYIKLYNLY